MKLTKVVYEAFLAEDIFSVLGDDKEAVWEALIDAELTWGAEVPHLCRWDMIRSIVDEDFPEYIADALDMIAEENGILPDTWIDMSYH